MEKIKLNDNCKRLLKEIKSGLYQDILEPDIEDLNFLKTEGLIDAVVITTDFMVKGLTDKGRAYLHSNPNLKNPSIWDDKKYLINTVISLIALVVAIIALFV